MLCKYKYWVHGLVEEFKYCCSFATCIYQATLIHTCPSQEHFADDRSSVVQLMISIFNSLSNSFDI